MSKADTAWLNEETGDIHSPRGRLAWVSLLKPRENKKIPGSTPKYQAVLMIPKTANIKLLSDAITEAAVAKHGKDWKTKKLRLPLQKTADEPKLAEYADDYPYLLKTAANADYPPYVVGPDTKPFKGTEQDIYPGRWAVVAGGAWGYSTGSMGVGWNCNRVQLLQHDDALPIRGGPAQTSSGFEAIEDDGEKASTSDDIFA